MGTPSAAECCRAAVLYCVDAVPDRDRLTQFVLWLPFASTILRILRRYLGQLPKDQLSGSFPLTPSASIHVSLAGSGLHAGPGILGVVQAKLLARQKLQRSGSSPMPPKSGISRAEG